ncbi:MAG: hypothetical protein KAS04_05775 [Candidatus Aenigmarchaeota archaeon]|nr:hypothetical protein [Candidatus Aenigmarchaeota archaeon]
MNETIKKIVIERLNTMPSNMRLLIGGEGKFDKHQLIKEVENETEMGELVAQIYMNGIRSFKSAANV